MPCVAIEVREDGTVSVGPLPPEAVAQYAQAMKPVQSVDEALSTAQGLLSNPQQVEQQAAQEAFVGA